MGVTVGRPIKKLTQRGSLCIYTHKECGYSVLTTEHTFWQWRIPPELFLFLIYNFFPEEKTSIFRIFRKNIIFVKKHWKLELMIILLFLSKKTKKRKTIKTQKQRWKTIIMTVFWFSAIVLTKTIKWWVFFPFLAFFCFFPGFFLFSAGGWKKKKIRENNKKMWR